MKRLIVNADDLGRTAGINRGILEAHRDGIVTSATLMVNYPAAEQAARLAAECPSLGVGLHVALSGGVPTLPPERVPSLVDDSGRLPAKPDGLARAVGSELLAEVRAQLGRFEALTGRLPTHFDSHHHSHRLPAVLEVLVALARETGRPLRLASPEMEEPLRAAGIPTTGAFVESFYDEGATLPALLDILAGLAEGSTELMCHPAHVDAELAGSSGYAGVRARELQILTSDEARRAVADHGIDLINFAQL